jgi:hypothetical protein
MRRSCLALSMATVIVMSLSSAAGAADMPNAAPYAAPPAVVETAPPLAPVGPAACWRYGELGWGWYPCYAGPYPYRHYYRWGWRPGWGWHHDWRRW